MAAPSATSAHSTTAPLVSPTATLTTYTHSTTVPVISPTATWTISTPTPQATPTIMYILLTALAIIIALPLILTMLFLVSKTNCVDTAFHCFFVISTNQMLLGVLLILLRIFVFKNHQSKVTPA